MTKISRSAAVVAALSAPAVLASADVLDDIGYPELLERLGAAAPTGAGVVVGQVEVPDPGYGPNQGDSEFSSVDFIERSGAAGTSSHATEVGTRLYGATLSPAPGIPTVYLWDVNDFLFGGYLKVNQSTGPSTPPGGLKIFNNSWIGSFGSNATDNQALRRADYASNTFRTLWVTGVNNGAGSAGQPLLSGMYHGISVGLANGEHASNDTASGLDGPGRMKPDIVAPGDFTSFSTPLVGAAAALLIETAETDPVLSGSSSATQPYVLKSVLLAGAVRDQAWTNDPATSGPDRGATARPLDEVFGAGVLNVDRAHRILTGYEASGESSVPTSATVTGPCWDFESLSAGEVYWHRFSLEGPAAEIGVVLTWHRVIPTNFTGSTVGDGELELFSVDAKGAATSLRGAGPGIFSSGNVVSESGVDNVELLHVRDLKPGEYAVRISRIDTAAATARAAVAFWIPETAEEPLVGDLDGDGRVNGADFGLLLSLWGSSGPVGDLDGDGAVGGSDIGALLANWTG